MEHSGLDERRLSLLVDIGTSIVAELDSDNVLRRVLEGGRELTGARYAAVGILDPEHRELDRFLTTGIDEATRRAIGDLPRGAGILGELIRHPEPLRLEDISEHPRSYGFPPGHPPMTTFLGAPILVRGEAWGNIYLTEKLSGPFDEADEQALVVLSKWVAIAIENARLYENLDARRSELERAASGLEATVAISRAVAGETDLDRVLELVAKRARALVDARVMLVLLEDASELCVAAAAGEGGAAIIGSRLPLAGTALGETMRSGRGERIDDTASRVRLGLEQLAYDAGAAMLVPLTFRGRGIGILAALDRYASSAGFSADDERLMRAFAGSAATALATAQNVEAEQLRMSIASADQERRRWARELHDETLQGLGALKVMLTSGLQRDDPETLRAAAEQAVREIESQIAELQGLITDLRPAALDDLGLEPALEALFARVREVHGLTVTSEMAFEPERGESRLEAEIEGAIYRLVQEALSNTARHAGADSASVHIVEAENQISLEVRDEGQGFDTSGPRGGFGLLGMRERIELAGGTLEVDSRPGEGTRVVATLPARRLDVPPTGSPRKAHAA